MKKILVIVGPTASGKSDLAILLAKKYNGEIISADSRQVYRGMDIGTGKVPRDHARSSKLKVESSKGKAYFSHDVAHHLLDVASPKRSYNVTHFIRDAKKALADIQRRGKLPILCGGSGFWVQALLEGAAFPVVKPNLKLRKRLGRKTNEELFQMLKSKDPRRAQDIDVHNKIRLIRALEIIETLGKVPSLYHVSRSKYQAYILVLNPKKETLQGNIKKRLQKRLKQGMIEEVQRLRKQGLSWRRLESFGLEYKNIALFVQKKISRDEVMKRILIESHQYAKRQLTWLRRWQKQGTKIDWAENPEQAEYIIEKAFL